MVEDGKKGYIQQIDEKTFSFQYDVNTDGGNSGSPVLKVNSMFRGTLNGY
jgi:V8-like Glu-specific endopeptidase